MFRKFFSEMSAFQRISSFSSFSQNFFKVLMGGLTTKKSKIPGWPLPTGPNVFICCDCNLSRVIHLTPTSHFFVFSKKFKKTMFKKLTPCGTRTRNLWIRSPTRYPLRQRGLIWFSSEKKRNNEWEPCTKKNSPAGNWTRVFAWQAEILTSILPRIQSSLWFNFAHQNGLKWAQKRRKCTKIREQKMNRSRQDLNLRGQSPMDF